MKKKKNEFMDFLAIVKSEECNLGESKKSRFRFSQNLCQIFPRLLQKIIQN